MNSSQHCGLTTLELAQRARKDQGFYENEVSFGGEADLHRHLIDCTKNPAHEGFIPIKKFSISHLPVPYQDQNLFSCIKLHADLTARVLTSCTSIARPEFMPGTENPFPFYNFRGVQCIRLGSGLVSQACEKVMSEENRACPCPECASSSTPKQEWGSVLVRTAAHVIYNSEEASKTKFELYYDDNDDRETIRTLQGVKIEKCDVVQDWSLILCITHDLETWDRLDADCKQCWNLQETVRAKFFQLRQVLKMAIIISHPHGCSKQVSLGEWMEREEADGGYTKYNYKACTCPGSSGAPTIILGRKWWLYTEHAHSGRCEINDVNVSGYGYDVD